MSMIDPTVRPTKVDRPSDATGLVDTGKLVQLLPNPADAAAVMLAAQNLSRPQGRAHERERSSSAS